MHIEPIPRKWWTRGLFWVVLLVTAALAISGSFTLAMWLVPSYRATLAQEVSKAIGHPVAVGKLSLIWRWAQPMLEAQSITLLAEDAHTPLLNAQKLRLGFEPWQLLRGRMVPSEIDVTGLALAIEIDAQGHAHLRGLISHGEPPTLKEVLHQLKRFARIKADNVSLAVRDVRVPKGNFAVVLNHGDLRIEPLGLELRASLSAPGVLAESITLRLGLGGDLDAADGLSGQWTLDADNIVAGAAVAARAPVLAPLRFDKAKLQASGEWTHMALGESNLTFEAARASTAPSAPTPAAAPSAQLRNLAFVLRYTPAAAGGALQIKNLQLIGSKGAWPMASARLAWRQAGGGREWNGSADFLRLDDLSPWLGLLPQSNPQSNLQSNPQSSPRPSLVVAAVPAAAGGAAPAAAEPPAVPQFMAMAATAVGDVQGLEGRYAEAADGSPRYAVHARLLGLGLGPATVVENGMSGLRGLSGDLSADETGGKLSARGESVSLVLPRTLSSPVVFDALSASFDWQRVASGWHVHTADLAWRASGAQGKGTVDLSLPAEESPRLNLNLHFSAADAARLKPWMPRQWGEHLKDWLDHAIVRARVPEAHLWINGPLADFPFHKNPSGDWGLDLTVAGARLEYQPDWPGADQLSASLQFRGNGLVIDLDRASLAGVAATDAHASIADFSESPLLIDLKTRGEAALYYQFLNASPLQERLRGLLTQTAGEGPAQTDVHLEIPLHSDLGQKMVASGVVRLKDNRLRVLALAAPVEGIGGSLRFGGGVGVAATGLRGRYYDTPVTADIAAGADGYDTLTARFAARTDEPAGLVARYLPGWLRENLTGTANWRLLLPLTGPQGGKVTLASNLVGVASSLPAPLAKTAAEILPLSIVLDSDNNTPLRLALDAQNRLGLTLRFGREHGELVTRGVSIALGGGSAGMAAEEGLRISGKIERLNPPDWLGLIGSLHGAGLPFLGAQFVAQHLVVGSYETADVAVSASKSREGAYSLGLSGVGGAGNASLAADGSHLKAELSRLKLQATPEALQAVGRPPPSKLAAATAAVADTATIDPVKLPALDLRVAALTIGGVPFGAFNFATERTASGQTLTSCVLSGGAAQLTATGYWQRNKAAAEAAANFRLDSDDLASVLRGLGFAPTLSGRSAVIKGALNWSSARGGLDWAYARGKLDLSAENGALKSVDPGGAGRVLGLLNLYALPRRLTLDFRDVTSKGLGYDRIEGGFDLADGVAEVRKLSISGPSVKMEISGHIGLAARDLDQTVTVVPNTAGLTLGAVLAGALAVAPAVGVLAVIANQVLDKPIGQATQFSYRVTGPWDNPEIRRGDGSAVRPGESPESPAPEAAPAPSAPPAPAARTASPAEAPPP